MHWTLIIAFLLLLLLGVLCLWEGIEMMKVIF